MLTFVFLLQLMNIPTPVEALKTYDNKVFHKSGDIGQILQVFRDEHERDDMRQQLVNEPHDLYYPHGLTAPTEDIVRRRFEATQSNENFLIFRYQEVLADVLDFSTRSGGNLIPLTKPQPAAVPIGQDGENEKDNGDEKLPYYETVIEEVLDYQEYMMDIENPGHGRTFVFDGMTWTDEQIELVAQHPEILWSRLEEEDDVLEKQGQEMLRRKAIAASSSSSAAATQAQDQSMSEVTMETLSLQFRKNADGTGIELEDNEQTKQTSSDFLELSSTQPTTTSTTGGDEEIAAQPKRVEPSRGAAMLSMLYDGEGEDAEEGEGEQDEAALEAEEAVVATEEGDGGEGGDGNEEADDDWMDDL